ncbi:MAG: hypothetical protein ACFFD2_26985 [Promethearchaeota archaeon]
MPTLIMWSSSTPGGTPFVTHLPVGTPVGGRNSHNPMPMPATTSTITTALTIFLVLGSISYILLYLFFNGNIQYESFDI